MFRVLILGFSLAACSAEVVPIGDRCGLRRRLAHQPPRGHGRTQLLLAQALVARGDHEAALELLDTLEVPDLAEGDIPTAELWHVLRPGEPVPERLDFRMSREA